MYSKIRNTVRNPPRMLPAIFHTAYTLLHVDPHFGLVGALLCIKLIF